MHLSREAEPGRRDVQSREQPRPRRGPSRRDPARPSPAAVSKARSPLSARARISPSVPIASAFTPVVPTSRPTSGAPALGAELTRPPCSLRGARASTCRGSGRITGEWSSSQRIACFADMPAPSRPQGRKAIPRSPRRSRRTSSDSPVAPGRTWFCTETISAPPDCARRSSADPRRWKARAGAAFPLRCRSASAPTDSSIGTFSSTPMQLVEVDPLQPQALEACVHRCAQISGRPSARQRAPAVGHQARPSWRSRARRDRGAAPRRSAARSRTARRCRPCR